MASSGTYFSSCYFNGPGGNGVVKLLYGAQHNLSLGSIEQGVLFSSVMPPTGVLSPSHPRPDRWYNDGFDYVDVIWDKPFAEATGYYAKANSTYAFVPGPSNADYQGSESASLSVGDDLAPGTNYVHLTTVGDSGEVGTVETRFAIKVNASPPAISSATHPSQVIWYDANQPLMSWTLPNSPADTSNLYWVLDPFPDTLPTVNDSRIPVDPAWPSTSSSLQLPPMANGIWFFHLRAQDTMGYLTKAAASYRLQIGPDPGVGTVSGSVVDEATGTPLRHVEVVLNHGLQFTRTNSLGQFAFKDNVYAQQYQIGARLSGYQESTQTIDVTANATTAVDLALQCLDQALCSSAQAELTPVDISAGFGHTCAVLMNGSVVCWGDNHDGQLGNGSTVSSLTPVSVPGLSGATSVTATGVEQCCPTITNHTCALLAEGTVACWGSNDRGQLGNGTTVDSLTPVSVSGLSNATAITVSGGRWSNQGFHTCALRGDRTVVCWGANGSGELGDGTTTDSSTPVSVSGLNDATAIAAGELGTCALRTNGTVKCWGNSSCAIQTDGTVMCCRNFNVAGLTGATAISAGHRHTCALLSDGTVACWNTYPNIPYFDLVTGTTTGSITPVQVAGITGATTITSGSDHVCAVLSGGAVACWGENQDGQLGDGTTTDSSTPVMVAGLTGATAIAAGDGHTCALLSDGRIACWGRNSSGQLGDGTTTGSLTPVAAQW